MKYFTKSEARAAAQAKKTVLKKAFEAHIMDSVTASTDADTFDIFLSHSIHDAELITGVKELLEKMGFSVYVDWDADPQMDRSTVSKKTAEILRKRMKQSKSLIYVATEKATASKWMPWELGFFDGHKPGQIAVLPLMDSESGTFPSQEYLGLYPQVTKDTYKGSNVEDIFVEDKGNRWATLAKFGKGATSWNSYG
ncbi:toll/interleukin-1 receptor domain-containing protein [Duganella radicis]|uniref:TIR domain-containing protein n=1 Tax=Duganella radicis TaxID=551988 RepID=A0A6L6PUK1_9BURK|nr:toll/interleukin-1 receptor domain-containing protein [Duganella radicis]MTV41935.1 TIR domain-containing protein [Duganella radicis]